MNPWVVIFPIAIAALGLGLASSAFSSTQTLNCQNNYEQIISKFGDVLSTRNTELLPDIVTDDIFFDITASGGPGPIVGIADLTDLLDFLKMIIRTQTSIIVNPLFDGCSPTIRANYMSLQAADAVLQPGDMNLPALTSAGPVEIRIRDNKVSRFILLTNLTQVLISPSFNGVIIPPVSRKRVTDEKALQLLLSYINNCISMGFAQVAEILRNTNLYHRLVGK
jgi:hypothetical protein